MHDCSLDVAAGEIVVLMGLSGVRQIHAAAGGERAEPDRAGRCAGHDGTDLVSVPNASRATLRRMRTQTVAMVFQQFGLLPWRSVRENVGLGLELAGMGKRARREKIDAQLELVGLTQWADQPVSALSGGMQQRVGLARAFATDAPVLLMDEPFSALDPLIRARLQDELAGTARAVETHHRLCQPRSGRSVQAGQPHCHPGRRADDPMRHARGHFPDPRQPVCRRFRRQHEPAGRAARAGCAGARRNRRRAHAHALHRTCRSAR